MNNLILDLFAYSWLKASFRFVFITLPKWIWNLAKTVGLNWALAVTIATCVAYPYVRNNYSAFEQIYNDGVLVLIIASAIFGVAWKIVKAFKRNDSCEG